MISPADRIQQIRTSQQVFVCGFFGLLPLIGFIPSIWAVVSATQLGRRFGGEWNPAAAQVRWGVTLALFNVGITTIAVLILVLRLVPPFGQS